MKVYKYSLAYHFEVQQVELPIGAQVLSVGLQYGVIQLWAMVEPRVKLTEKRTFLIIATGSLRDLPETAEFIGRIDEGQFVWHVFELPTVDR